MTPEHVESESPVRCANRHSSIGSLVESEEKEGPGVDAMPLGASSLPEVF